MPEAPKPEPKEGLLDRAFHRQSSEEAVEIGSDSNPQQQGSQGHRRRNSALQRFKNFVQSQDELDEAGKTYAKLM
ncbi:hypothetical protein BJX99DRAFT_232867 [Aspergillus californicus]